MYKHSGLLSCSINGEDGKFYTAATRWSSTLRPKKKWTTKNTFGPSNRSTVSSHLFIKSLTALAAPTECYKLPVDYPCLSSPSSGNTKGGSITVPLTSCLTGLDQSVSQIKTKIVSCHTADSKPVKQEVNGTVILLPLVFPAFIHIYKHVDIQHCCSLAKNGHYSVRYIKFYRKVQIQSHFVVLLKND